MSRYQANNPHGCPDRQRGAALMVMLVIMIIGSAAFLVSSLSTTALKNARQETTANALAQAKEALIGRAVADNNMPGSLPCPDTDDNGSAELLSGNDCPSYIGRLPWKTLGLPDLRDGSGERLWYALSTNFRDDDSARPLNSDTAGTITVRTSAGNIINNGCSTYGLPNCPNPSASDAAFGTGAVAVIIAPGGVLTRTGGATAQDRSSTGINNPQNYLEVFNDYLDKINSNYPHTLLYEDNANFADGLSTDGFIQGEIKIYNPATNAYDLILNDQLLIITRDNLFPPVERVVGKRFKDLPLLNTYYATWGAFPFAAPFVDPSLPFTDPSTPFIGAANTYSGLLPMGAVWSSIPTYTLTGGSADVTCELRNGYNSLANARTRCYTTNIVGTPTISITGTLAGLRLWRLHNLTDVNQVRVRVTGINWSASTVTGMNATIGAALNADGGVTVTFTGRLVSGVERIELRDVVVDPSVDPVDPAYAWFTRNRWNQVMYYAVSPGYAPGGGNACTPLPGTPSCLTVNGSGGGNNKRAAIIMAGGALTGQTHPSGSLANYLEGENATPADFIYENKSRASTFNDQMIIIAP